MPGRVRHHRGVGASLPVPGLACTAHERMPASEAVPAPLALEAIPVGGDVLEASYIDGLERLIESTERVVAASWRAARQVQAERAIETEGWRRQQLAHAAQVAEMEREGEACIRHLEGEMDRLLAKVEERTTPMRLSRFSTRSSCDVSPIAEAASVQRRLDMDGATPVHIENASRTGLPGRIVQLQGQLQALHAERGQERDAFEKEKAALQSAVDRAIKERDAAQDQSDEAYKALKELRGGMLRLDAISPSRGHLALRESCRQAGGEDEARDAANRPNEEAQALREQVVALTGKVIRRDLQIQDLVRSEAKLRKVAATVGASAAVLRAQAREEAQQQQQQRRALEEEVEGLRSQNQVLNKLLLQEQQALALEHLLRAPGTAHDDEMATLDDEIVI